MFDDVEEQAEENGVASVSVAEDEIQVPPEPTQDTTGDSPPSTEVGNVHEPNIPVVDQPASEPILEPAPIAVNPVEIRQTSSSRLTGSWRRRNERVRDLDLQQESGGAEESGSGSGSSSSGEGGHEGPMTPMNDAGPFVFDGGAFPNLAESPSGEGLVGIAVTAMPRDVIEDRDE